jgi:hypothetical protein
MVVVQIRRGQVSSAVETVEKVSFQKLFLKSGKEMPKNAWLFGNPHNILAIFEPVVGDFCEHFSNQGFFDSLVSITAQC